MRRLIACPALALSLMLLAACARQDGPRPRSAAAEGSAAGTAGTERSGADSALLARADAGRIKGDSSAAIWIVEVSDFQCPYCKRFVDETYPRIEREMIRPGIVRLAYINLPLSIHPNAPAAAETAMCASEQNHFWPVHDALFRTQAQWARLNNPTMFLDSLAATTGLDTTRYRNCLASHVIRELIEADVARAQSSGVNSTPYFFIDGQRIEGAAPYEQFREAVSRAIAARADGRGQRGAPGTRTP